MFDCVWNMTLAVLSLVAFYPQDWEKIFLLISNNLCINRRQNKAHPVTQLQRKKIGLFIYLLPCLH